MYSRFWIHSLRFDISREGEYRKRNGEKERERESARAPQVYSLYSALGVACRSVDATAWAKVGGIPKAGSRFESLHVGIGCLMLVVLLSLV